MTDCGDTEVTGPARAEMALLSKGGCNRPEHEGKSDLLKELLEQTQKLLCASAVCCVQQFQHCSQHPKGLCDSLLSH